MSIGERIRAHRKKNNLTQKELALRIGVSVQAISKWERDIGMPDVVCVVPLAQALHITTDELLENRDRRKELEQQWHQTMRQYGEGSPELIALEEQALKEFPEDKTFRYRLAMDLYFAGKEAKDPADNRLLQRSVYYFHQLNRADPADETAISGLVQAYAAMGQKDNARTYAEMSKTHRDGLLKLCLEEEELRRHRQRIIYKKFRALLREIGWEAWYWDGWEEPAILDAAEALIRAMLPDGNYRGFWDDLLQIELRRALWHLRQDDRESALTALRAAFEYARQMDSLEDQARFTAPVFDRLTGRERIHHTAVENYLWWLENKYPQLEKEPDLENLMGMARQWLKNRKD